jgi:hypothetical protein
MKKNGTQHYIKNIGVWRFLKAIKANEKPPNIKFGF